MDNCIFCKIKNKKIPADVIYENKDFLSFLDINPVSNGHLLIIPKKHTAWMTEVDDITISKIFKLAKKLMLLLKKRIKCDYVQVSVIGEEVKHFHIHLIPRYFNDNLKPYKTKKYTEKEKMNIKKKLMN